MAVPEKTVLKPKDPILVNSDEWATFSIRKVKVVSQDNGELASLLSAHKDHPVKVTGQLQEIEEDYQHLSRLLFSIFTASLANNGSTVLDPSYQRKTIELNSVTTYAFAEYQDGSYGFWAAGQAGWFEFDSSASAYRSIHHQMSEATSLLYFLADKLRRTAKQKPKLIPKEHNKYVMRLFRDVGYALRPS